MTDTTPPVRPEDPETEPDKPPVLQSDGSSTNPRSDAASAPALRPREGGPETTA